METVMTLRRHAGSIPSAPRLLMPTGAPPRITKRPRKCPRPFGDQNLSLEWTQPGLIRTARWLTNALHINYKIVQVRKG
jgi:hypothetical protein